MADHDAAAALSAYRAACVALVRFEGDGHERAECTYCYDAHRADSTCPVALARAALEKFPEVTG